MSPEGDLHGARRTRRASLSPALAGLAALALALPLPRAADAQETGDFEWRGTLAAGETLEVRGVNGDIEAVPASGGEVEVRAVKRAKRSDPASVRIEVVEHDGGVTVCAVYPTPPGKRPNECRPGGGGSSVEDNDVAVDFTVRMPPGAVLEAHTVNGDVAARDLGGDVDASTVNGSVDVSTAGSARARTVNGSIDVALGRLPAGGDLRFETVNGGITLRLPAGAGAEVEAETVNGDLDTDFPLTIQGRWGPRRLHGTIGDGGPRLRLETVNGGIRLRRGS